MYKPFHPCRDAALTLILLLLPGYPALCGEFGFEAGFGAGVWGGPWSRAIRDSQDSLGLDTNLLLSPTGTAAAVWKGPELFGPVRLGAAAGLGLWSGALAGYQGDDLEQAHSMLAFALEARPRLMAEFPIKQGAFLLDISLGVGFVLGSLLSIDALPGLRSVSKTPPDFFQRFLGIAGLGIGYRFTRSFSLFLRIDGGIADFDPAPGSDPTLMGRLQVTAGYDFYNKESL